MMLHRRPLVKAVAASLRRRCRVKAGARILVAVSGGADSVALLRALAALAVQKHWRLDLRVGHVHHHLRDEADAEADFVRDLARTLALPFSRRDIRPADEAGNVEGNARRLRYAALAEMARDFDAEFVATAHHADDQLETLLMRLMRGASVRGMAGIRARRRLDERCRLIRPMLDVDHAAAVELLKDIGQLWCEDATNAAGPRWRARLRHDVLPVLRAMRPDAAIKAAATARRLHEAAKVFADVVRHTGDDLLVDLPDGRVMLERDHARRMPPEVLSDLIRRESIEGGSPADALSASLIESIVQAVRDTSGERRQFILPGGVHIEIDRTRLCWNHPPHPL